MNGLKAWRQLTPGYKPKPKSLILSDWTAINWDDHTLQATKKLLEQLIHDGFKLYIKQLGDIKPLALEDISSLDKETVRSNMTPDSPQSIKKSASLQLNLPDDQLHILDDYWLSNLLAQQERPGNRQLSIKKAADNNPFQIVDALTNAVPPLAEIIHDEFSDNANETLQDIQNEMPDIPVKSQYKHLELDADQIDSLTGEVQEAVSKNGMIFPASHLLGIECFTASEGDVSALLPLLPALEELNLPSYQGGLPRTPLDKLQRLVLSQSELDFRSLTSFLETTTQLKYLDISECDIVVGEEEEEEEEYNLHLANLEELSADTNNLTINQLLSLIKRSQKLKVLNISHNDSPGYTFSNDSYSTDYALPGSLKYFNAKNSLISFPAISALLAQAKALEYLDLNSNDLSYSASSEDLPLPLESLKTLMLTSATIHLSGLQKIIANSVALETLDLNNCKMIFDLTHPELNLDKLKKLVISHEFDASEVTCFLSQLIDPSTDSISLKELHLGSTVVSTEILMNVLPKTRCLEKLDLSKCSQLITEFPEMDLSSLIELDISNTPINTTSFKNLLRQAKNLKYLHMKNCPNISLSQEDRLHLPKLELLEISEEGLSNLPIKNLVSQLPSLTSLCFNNSQSLLNLLAENINLDQLRTLTVYSDTVQLINWIYLVPDKTPELKTLLFQECTFDFSPEQPHRILEHIENIYLQKSQFPGNDLFGFLTYTPNIKTLNIDNCKSFSITQESTLSLPKLYSLRINKTEFDADTLKKILRAAPNLKKLDISNAPGLYIDDTLKELMKTIQVTTKNLEEKVPSAPVQGTLNNQSKYERDTRLDPDKTYNVKRLFFPIIDSKDVMPEPSDYRLSSYNTLRINEQPCKIVDAFFWSNEGDPLLTACSISPTEHIQTTGRNLAFNDPGSSYFISPQTMQIGREWTAIASLVSQEEITHYQIQPDCPVEIAYSYRDKLYYIRTLEKGQRTIQFKALVKIPQPLQAPPLPENIQRIIKNISGYTGGDLNLGSNTQPNGHDYINCIYEQRIGACGHRAIVFKVWMAQYYPEIPVYIIDNGCHAFVEFEMNGYRYKVDLGGLPANLNIEENNPLTEKIVDEVPLFYRQLLQTWKRQKREDHSVAAFCQRLAHPTDITRQLIELNTTSDLQALQLSLQSYCQSISKPFFSINSAEDLFFLSSADSEDDAKTASVGRLQRFLEQSQTSQTPPVIVINYEQLDADDIVKFSDFMDKEGKSIQIIGLINIKKPDCYQGADLYSRFDSMEQCKLPSAALAEYEQKKAPLPLIEHSSQQPTYPINFFHNPDWKEHLLGQWRVKKDTLVFSMGELERALVSTLPIELQNAPWDDPSFALFWKQAFLSGVVENTAGKPIEIHDFFRLTSTEGYPWADLTTTIRWEKSTLLLDCPLLNPENFSDFFQRYDYDDEHKTLDTMPGHIQAHANQNLTVHLTRELSLDQWARLLSHCQQFNVQLTVCCAPQVSIPPEVLPPELSRELTHQDGFTPRFTTQVVTSDPDTVISQMVKSGDWLVWDISECAPEDLLIHTHGERNKETQTLRFSQSQRALLNAFAEKKQVILKGNFSDELIDSLTAFILKRERDPDTNTQLLLISERPCVSCLKSQLYEVDVAAKKSCLIKEYSEQELALLSESLLETESLSRLKARLTYHRIHPEDSMDNAWKGMYDLPGGVALEAFDAEHSLERAQAFNRQRYERFMTYLAHSPFVCATGLTGTGKSTFFELYFNTEHSVLYNESQKKQWAEDHSDKLKILFIDEANLSPRQWSEFEGLFNKPPGILIDGHYYPLTDTHKVVFVSNPLSYGGERTLAPFFERHGGAMVFEPLSLEFVYEYLLKPVFEHTPLEDRATELCQPILDMYAFLCTCSKTEVLISPRELQMIALLVLSATQKNQRPEQALHAVHYYLWQVAMTLVPEANKTEFNNRFKPFEQARSEREEHARPGQSGFLITESRREIAQLVNDFLQLRHLQRHASGNDAQLYGGLGGIIVEGLPGIGKTKLLPYLLISNGYQQIHENHKGPLPDKGFYRIPSNIPESAKIALIKRAFNGGYGIVVDEINSSPMLELELNSMLMGKTLDGKRPDNPGFFLLATQNPITMAGRRATSTAIKRRVMTINLPEYTADEMKTILLDKGVDKDVASHLVQAYQFNKKKAQTEHLTPEPTFRDLKRAAKPFTKHKTPLLKRKEREKGKEKEKEKEREQPGESFLTPRDKAYSELGILLNKYRQIDPSFFSFENKSNMSILIKIMRFFETNQPIEEVTFEELNALNSPSLSPVIHTIAQSGLMEGSRLQWNGEAIEFINPPWDETYHMDF